jgi:hypothetical protein
MSIKTILSEVAFLTQKLNLEDGLRHEMERNKRQSKKRSYAF